LIGATSSGVATYEYDVHDADLVPCLSLLECYCCFLLKLALFINQEELLAEEQRKEEKNVEDEVMQSQDLFGVSSSLEETAPAAASSQLTPTPTLQIMAPTSGTPCSQSP
jgi:hypothetical protein